MPHHLISGITISLAIQARDFLPPPCKSITDTYWSHECHPRPRPPPPPRHTHSHLRFITSDMSCLDYYNSLNLLSLPSARGSHFLYLRHKKSINNLSCCDVSTRDWEGDSTGLETCSAPVFWGGGGRDEESRGLGLSCRLSEAFSLEVQTHFLALRNQDSSYTRVFLSF